MTYRSCRFCRAVIVVLVAVVVLTFGVRSAQAQAPGVITTIVGDGNEPYAPVGDGGPANNAELNNPICAVVDAAGNLYICDGDISRVRKVSAATGIITTVAGNGSFTYSGDGGPATSASLSDPLGVAVDAAGDLYIADYSNNRIRKVSAATGIITTVVASSGTYGYSGDGGLATSAEMRYPDGIAVDSAGNLYIADSTNQVIRKVTAATGIITTFAGNGFGAGISAGGGYSGDGGPATSAELNGPWGLTVDAADNLYIADYFNNCIRKVSAATGVITTVAGNGTAGYSGDGGPATSAELRDPTGVAVDGAGNLYIADEPNQVIRKVSAATGAITTIAGQGGTRGYGGDNGPAINSILNDPFDVKVDAAGNLYITDSINNRIRKVTGPIPGLIYLVISDHLPVGIQFILTSTLTAAEKAPNTRASCHDLTAFIGEVDLIRALRVLTPAEASQLITETNQIKVAQDCP